MPYRDNFGRNRFDFSGNIFSNIADYSATWLTIMTAIVMTMLPAILLATLLAILLINQTQNVRLQALDVVII